MNTFRIQLLNKIAPEGLQLLDEQFHVGKDQEDPHGILVRSAKVDTDLYPSLLAVARAGAGVNNITVEKATARGICIFNTPGANANAVAELVFIMLGMSARNIHSSVAFCKSLADGDNATITKQVEEEKSAFRGVELSGRTLGVLGLGKIGVKVANLGIMHGMKVIGYDPFPALENIHELSPQVILARSLRDIVQHVDIFSVHTPLNDKTRGLVNSALLNQLPDGAVLVNYARGPIVDEGAVLAALDRGKLATYITDFPSTALLNHPKVLATPHLGASTEESEEQCSCMAVNELRAYLRYGNITHSVNFPTVESLPSDAAHTRFIVINRDVPGMIGFASHTIGSHGINIASYLNESNGVIGYNIIDLEQAISPEVIGKIEANPDIIRTRTISFK